MNHVITIKVNIYFPYVFPDGNLGKNSENKKLLSSLIRWIYNSS